MRQAVLLTVLALMLSAGLVVAAPPSERWDHPADARAHLIPPAPGVAWPAPQNQGDPLALPSPAQTTGVARVLVLLVDFQDVAPDATHTGAYFNGFYNDVSPGSKSFRAYYAETSLG
ncbi:MAG: hypothetical protein ACREDF_04940, partial [Thermoplasmata archaeon]